MKGSRMNEHVENIMKVFPEVFNSAVCEPETTRDQFVKSNPTLTKLTDSMIDNNQ